MNSNNFNTVAWCYDALVFIIFGNKLKYSQIILLNQIKDGDTLLVMGGGTGWIIEELCRRYTNIRICYIELSEQMLRKAIKVGNKFPQVTIQYIHGDENSIPNNIYYDAILTFYFFDLFNKSRVKAISEKLHQSLKETGILLVADFFVSAKSTFTQRVLLKSMYFFFRLISNIESSSWVDFREVLRDKHFFVEHSYEFSNGFILAELYKKNN